MRQIVIILLLLGLYPSPLAGQTMVPVPPGTQVRVRLLYRPAGKKHLVGVVDRFGRDSLILGIERPPAGVPPRFAIPLGDIETLQTHAGRSRATGRGIAIGIGAGLAVMTTVGAIVFTENRECSPSDNVFARGVPSCDETSLFQGLLRGAVLGLVGGAGIGAAVGSLVTVDVWRERRTMAAPPGAISWSATGLRLALWR